jgi:topoisomerase IA-like protein
MITGTISIGGQHPHSDIEVFIRSGKYQFYCLWESNKTKVPKRDNQNQLRSPLSKGGEPWI